MPVRGARLTPSFSINMGALWSISLSYSRVKYSWKNVESERESSGQEIGRKRAGRGGFVSPARRTVWERGGRVVMNTQSIENGLEKDSKAVVQSDRVSGVTTDSSAKTIGQSEPV